MIPVPGRAPAAAAAARARPSTRVLLLLLPALLLLVRQLQQPQRALEVAGATLSGRRMLQEGDAADADAASAPPALPDGSPGKTFFVARSVEQPVLLQAMLNASVTQLQFGPAVEDFRLVEAAWVFITQRTPLSLTRNFTVVGRPGGRPPTLFDFQHLQDRVLLEPGVTFALRGLTLAHSRKVAAQGVEFFGPSPGATLLIEDSTFVDEACARRPAEALALARAAPPLPGRPPNRAELVPEACVELPPGGRRCFADAVRYAEWSGFAARPGAGASGAAAPRTALLQRNVTAACAGYLDKDCLARRGADACWELRAAQAAGGGGAAAAAAAAPRALGAGAVAGIAVAAAVALLLAVALCAALFCCTRRRRRRSAARAAAALPGAAKLAAAAQDGSMRSTIAGGPPCSRCDDGSTHSLGSAPSGQLRATTHGRCSKETVPSGGEPPPGDVGSLHLGVLLGAGSFGRVYKARYHGSDVAIKIVPCRESELPRVLREAEIMLKLDCEFIVRALGCSVVRRGAVQQRDRSGGGGGSGGAAAAAPTAAAAAGRQGSSASGSTSVARTPGGTPPPDSVASGGAGHQSSASASASPMGAWELRAGGSASPRGPAVLHWLSRHAAASPKPQGTGAQGDPALPGAGAAASASAVAAAAATASADRTHDASSQLPPSLSVLPASTSQLEQPADELGMLSGSVIPGEEIEVWLVLELCTAGTLRDVMRRPRSRMDLAQLLCRLLEVARGMEYLHSMGVLHGDLKAANVLLKSALTGSYGQVAKISDFGMSSLLDGATHRSTKAMGTITHTAPEVLTTGRLAPPADVYAYGILMWELFTQKSPFANLHYGAVVQRVVVAGERPPLPRNAPEELSLLMRSCWAADPAERPTFAQVVECLELMIDHLDGVDEAQLQLLGLEDEGQRPGSSLGQAAAGGGSGSGSGRGAGGASGGSAAGGGTPPAARAPPAASGSRGTSASGSDALLPPPAGPLGTAAPQPTVRVVRLQPAAAGADRAAGLAGAVQGPTRQGPAGLQSRHVQDL